MTTEIATLAGAQLPAHITGGAEQAAGMVTSESVPRISLRDASFILKKDGDEIKVGMAKPIQVVIMGIDPPEPKHTAKQWYGGAWTEDSADAPDCFSNDGIRPDQSIAEPQWGTCAHCPKNAWGSGHDADGNASKGKACSDRKSLLVVLSGKHMDGDVFRLSVPPTSLKALSTYGRELVRYNVNMHKIVTQVSVDEDNPKAMQFGYSGYLNEADATRMAARAGSPEISEMIHKALPAPDSGPSMASPEPAGASDELDLDALGGEPAVQTQSRGKATKSVQTQTEKNPAVDDVEQDSAGHTWDGNIHSGSKTKLKADGTWKLKRSVTADMAAEVLSKQGVVAESQTTSEPTQESASSTEGDLDDLLSNWGDNV
jgi:hypothetical protein